MRMTELELENLLHRRAMAKKSGPHIADAPTAKPSKYRNQRTFADGVTFDSKREAECWMALRLRLTAGDIWDLQRQVKFPLLTSSAEGLHPVVCDYVADFVYKDNSGTHVVDAKGIRTQVYKIKKRWLYLQMGIEIEEV